MEKFFNYVRDNFELDGLMAGTLLWNILAAIEAWTTNEDEQYSMVCDLLDGIGLTDEEIKEYLPLNQMEDEEA